jgi:hypothetical protein
LTAVALWQVRGAAAANAVAVVLVAVALARLFPTAEGKSVSSGLGAHHDRGGPTVIADGPGTCQRAANYAALKDLPPGLVLGFIDAGPFILMETPHAVLAAPYHRNVKGNTAMLDGFLSPPEAARLKALGVDYVAFCPGAPERYNYAAAAPAGLAASLSRDEVPTFLERIALDGTELAVYRPRR